MFECARSACTLLLLVVLLSACATRAPVAGTNTETALPETTEGSPIDVPDGNVSTSESFGQPPSAAGNTPTSSVVKKQQTQEQSRQEQKSTGNESDIRTIDASASTSQPKQENPPPPTAEVITSSTTDAPSGDAPSGEERVRAIAEGKPDDKSNAAASIPTPSPLFIDQIRQTGKLDNSELSEVSGFAASRAVPGVLYAINDSGNSATLFALSESGQHLAQWTVKGRNRDWEDMATVTINGQHFLVIGDTGDNLKVHKSNRLYFFTEPLFSIPDQGSIEPDMTLSYVYEDGPRNVEAFAIHDGKVLLISKEPLQSKDAVRSRLYELSIPESTPTNNLTARFLTELPLAPKSLESSLAANFANVDLDHITALDFDRSGQRAFLLTYREVRVVQRSESQSWEEALQSRGKRLHFHNLGQSEALAVTADQSVFITSENHGAQIWAIPAK